MAQAIHLQATQGLRAYDYLGVTGLEEARTAGKKLTDFNREQQAQIVQDFYLLKQGRGSLVSSATEKNLRLYAGFVKDVSTLTVEQLLA